MISIKEININDYSYLLPEGKIAKYPCSDRDNSKLLYYKNGNISHTEFKKLPEFLSGNELFVFNDTKVIKARLHFKKQTGADVEIFCIEPYQPSEYSAAFSAKRSSIWKCYVGNLKKWKSGEIYLKIDNHHNSLLSAQKVEQINDTVIVRFEWEIDNTFAEIIEKAGNIPIPPYLNRNSEDIDNERYTTVYSKFEGSVAAPTAGLHFTENLIDKIREKGVQTEFVTLHVGAGTFKPVEAEKIGEHLMHTEYFSVRKETVKKILLNLGNITAVGTTSVRTLESLYILGVKFATGNYSASVSQWEAYDMKYEIEVKYALQEIIYYLEKNNLSELTAKTRILIAPGFNFRLTDKIITNFHQPKSTLLLLVSAFVGNDRERIYDYAINNDFRFLSYGDSSLLERNTIP